MRGAARGNRMWQTRDTGLDCGAAGHRDGTRDAGQPTGDRRGAFRRARTV